MSLDPTVLDASAINDAGEFEMMLFDDELWHDSEAHQRQLQTKVVAYMQVARTQPEAKDRTVRITIVGMYQPDTAGQQFLARLGSMVGSEGMKFKYDLHALSDSQW